MMCKPFHIRKKLLWKNADQNNPAGKEKRANAWLLHWLPGETSCSMISPRSELLPDNYNALIIG